MGCNLQNQGNSSDYYALPQLSLPYLLSVTGALGEDSKGRLHERAQKWDNGRMQTRLYEIIDRDRNGKMTAADGWVKCSDIDYCDSL